MVSRVDPNTWLSTAEFFRASLPNDQLPLGRGGPDNLARYYREAHPPAAGGREPPWLARRAVDSIQGRGTDGQDTIGGWDQHDTQPEQSPQIVIGRQPLPPSVDAIVVCKTRSKDIEHRAWATYAEIRGLNAVRQYYINHPNEFRHIPVPRVYTHSFQRPEGSLVYSPREEGFIIMEHIKDNRTLLRSFPKGDHEWTRRQKRRFVRQMALIRLQLLFIRNNKNGVEPPIRERGMLSTTLNKKAPKTAENATFWQARFNPPYQDSQAWVHAHLSRESTYWQMVANNNHLRHLLPRPMPIGPHQVAWFGSLQGLQTALQDPAVHRFRSEPFYVLTHDQLSPPNDPILMKGKRINCIVDWACSGYLPISENIKDILKQYQGAGLADPETWPDVGEPFSKCRHLGHPWEDWIENMRVNKWQLETTWNNEQPRRNRIAFEDRFNWYGRITPNDYRYGDKYADQDINEDDGVAYGSEFRHPVPIGPAAGVVYESNQEAARTTDTDFEWWTGPVMHLVNDYVQTHLRQPRCWSWPDPVIEEWGRCPITLGQPLGPP